MKLLFVVQRFGPDVLGGAESEARGLAQRLGSRGHEIEVLTSCARGYLTWENEYAPGLDTRDGLPVHRLPVSRPRDLDEFGRLSERVLGRPREVAFHLQKEWMRLQGPLLPDLDPWLRANSGGYDATVFFTYLYYTTWAGIAAARSPAVLRPTAHAEPPLDLPLFDGVFQMADGFAFGTPEEADLVRRRFGVQRPSRVTGIGTEVGDVADVVEFRRQFNLGDHPYLVFAGRIDRNKGAIELYEHFVRLKRAHPGPLRLVLIGSEVERLPDHPDVRKTGFVPDEVKNAGLTGALALVVPSYFESFSMVLAEGWALGVPAVVQGRSEVLLGQAMRSRGGLPYVDYEGFESAVTRLLGDRPLAAALGDNGRRYVIEHYSWSRVLDAWEALLAAAVTQPASAGFGWRFTDSRV